MMQEESKAIILNAIFYIIMIPVPLQLISNNVGSGILAVNHVTVAFTEGHHSFFLDSKRVVMVMFQQQTLISTPDISYL